MLNIFNKKINNSKSKIISVLKKENDLNKTIYYPAASKEWFNSIYAYNKNSLKWLPVADKIIIKLIKSYFNFYNTQDEIKVKFRRLRTRFRRLSINKIFVSRAELKHFSNKITITLYVYNRQKTYFLNKLRNLKIITPLKKKAFIKKIKLIKKQGLQVIKKVKREKKIILRNTSKKIMFVSFINKFKQYEKKHYENFLEKSLEKEILGIHCKHLLYFNKSKFENTYLFGLSNLIAKFFQKKIEFNLVNLKYLYLNSDILSESISMKIKNRKNRLFRVLKAYLKMVKLPYLNKLREYGPDNLYSKSDKTLLFEKNKNLNTNCIFSFKQTENKDALDQLLKNFFIPAETKQIETKQTEIKNQSLSCLEKCVLNSIKHKIMRGVRIETTGRLSRRLTASRSVFKFRYKGNIRNIDSSYKGLSSVMLRGYAKSNIQFTKINSKTRNGSFGIKGWVSGK